MNIMVHARTLVAEGRGLEDQSQQGPHMKNLSQKIMQKIKRHFLFFLVSFMLMFLVPILSS